MFNPTVSKRAIGVIRNKTLKPFITKTFFTQSTTTQFRSKSSQSTPHIPQLTNANVTPVTQQATTASTFSLKKIITTTGIMGGSLGLFRAAYSSPLSTLFSVFPLSTSKNSIHTTTTPSPNITTRSIDDPNAPHTITQTSPLTSSHQYYFSPGHKFPTLPTSTFAEINNNAESNSLSINTPNTAENYVKPAKYAIQPTVLIDLDKGRPWGLHYDKIPSDIQRVIAIGDIHACYDELIQLLESVDYNPHHDMLISLGDIVGKGPDGVKVLDFFYNLQRYVVENIDFNHPSTQIDNQWDKSIKDRSHEYKRHKKELKINDNGSIEAFVLPSLDNNNDDNREGIKPTTDDLLSHAIVHKAKGLNDLCANKLTTWLKQTTKKLGLKPSYAENGLKLHHNSRVFLVTGNHEQFLIEYTIYLKENGLLPEEAPIKSPTHLQVAQNLFSIDQNTPFEPLSSKAVDFQSYQKQLSKLSPQQRGEILTNRSKLLQQYTNSGHITRSNSRLEWLRTMPQYVMLPQLNLLCIHSGVPPDVCMLYPQAKPGSIDYTDGIIDLSTIESPKIDLTGLELLEIKQAQIEQKQTQQEQIANTRKENNILLSSMRPNSLQSYYHQNEVPDQGRYVGRILQRIPKSSLLNLRSCTEFPPKDARKHQNSIIKKFDPESPPWTNLLHTASTKFVLINKHKGGIFTPWAELYSQRIHHHKSLHPEDSTNYPHVLFGHDAVGGLQLQPHATGLDTGCCYGRELSGIVFHVDPTKPSQGFKPMVEYSRLKKEMKNYCDDDIERSNKRVKFDQSIDMSSTYQGVSNASLLYSHGKYTNQADITVPMELSHSIHTEQPIIIQIKSTRPLEHGGD
jgi:hypothetical protein